jgi:hypothetical protein
MAEKLPPQCASVQQPFALDPSVIHCPLCGNESFGDEEVTPCPHLAFIWLAGVLRFEYMSDEFAGRFAKVVDEDMEFHDFNEMLEAAGYSNTLLSIAINHCRTPCGAPRVYVSISGFDSGAGVGEEERGPELREKTAKKKATREKTAKKKAAKKNTAKKKPAKRKGSRS